ncbi:hypothetical protein OROHE_008646 [Orobanche hederae]
MKKEDTVKLISAEGFQFVIDKKAAMVSQTIRNMLTSPGGFAETEHGEVTFPEISTTILEKICQYFYWSLQYASPVNPAGLVNCASLYANPRSAFPAVFCDGNAESRFSVGSGRQEIKMARLAIGRIQWIRSGKETEFHIEPELTLELMMAANYLHT